MYAFFVNSVITVPIECLENRNRFPFESDHLRTFLIERCMNRIDQENVLMA